MNFTLLTNRIRNVSEGMMGVLEEFKGLQDKMETMVEKVRENGQQEFLLMVRDIFAKTPNLKAIRWEQYIPGFNDGEPCTFSVTDIRAKFDWPQDFVPKYCDDNTPEEWGENQDGFLDAWDIPESHPELKETLNEVSAAIRNEELFELIFPCHSQITVTADGVEICDYDCGY